MKLWNIHDDPTNSVDAEERWWCLVWADNARDAKLIAASVYSGDGPIHELRWDDFFDACASSGGVAEHDPHRPKVERNPIVQRLSGWREDGETECDCCGLYAMGMDAFYVCPDCRICKECGGCECGGE